MAVDLQVAGVVADNMALEALPVDREVGFLHYRLIPLLGMAVDECWWLEDIARQRAGTGRWEFMSTSGVRDLPGGVGSPRTRMQPSDLMTHRNGAL